MAGESSRSRTCQGLERGLSLSGHNHWMPLDEEERRTRASNRRTIVAFGVIVGIFSAPALFRIGRYLIEAL